MELLAIQRKVQGLHNTGSLLLELWMESWMELLLASCYICLYNSSYVSSRGIHTALNTDHSRSRGQIFRGIKRKQNRAEDYRYMESQL